MIMINKSDDNDADIDQTHGWLGYLQPSTQCSMAIM